MITHPYQQSKTIGGSMKSLLFLVLAASFLWAASDTLYDTSVATINLKNQPNSITVDKKGNATANLPANIMTMLPLDSVNGIMLNIQGAFNIWTDSAQLVDTIKLPSKNMPADSIFAYWQKEFKQYLKKLLKTKHVQ